MQGMALYFSASLFVLQCVFMYMAIPNVFQTESNGLAALFAIMVPIPFFIQILLSKGKTAFWLPGLHVAAIAMLASMHLTTIELFPVAGPFLWLFIGLMAWVMGGGVAYLLRILYNRFSWAFVLVAPALIVSIECFRMWSSLYVWFMPPPYMMFAYPLAGIPALIQMSSYTGAFGPEFMLFFIAAFISQLKWEMFLRNPRLRSIFKLDVNDEPMSRTSLTKASLLSAVLAGLMFLLLVIGNMDAARVMNVQANPEATVRPAFLQSQWDPSQYPRWNARVKNSAIRVYRTMCLEAAEKNAQLLVFSENALPVVLPGYQNDWVQFKEIFTEVNLPVVLGIITSVETERSFSIWYLFNQQGEVDDFYIKQYLVPFAEYMPLRSLLDPVILILNEIYNLTYGVLKISAIEQENRDLIPGTEGKVFLFQEHKFALTVCGETIFPKFYREAVQQGAELFFSPRAMNWFETPVDWNFSLQASIFRAVETRRWIGTVASMGSAAVIDAVGIVRKQTPYGQREVLVTELPYLSGQTFYVKYGDLFAHGCLLVILVFLALLGYPWIMNRFRK
jgi:apolipoprotein N-acyltransferase